MRIMLGVVVAGATFMAMSFTGSAPASAESVKLHAAGSLREAMNAMAAAFEKTSNVKVERVFGASGLLRGRIAKGEAAQVFASANMQHPASLAADGRSSPVALFARNELCAFLRPGLPADAPKLLGLMLDPALKLGTSTPRADPAGDYAFEVFARAETLLPGARAKLEAKALKLTGGPDSPKPEPGKNLYGRMIDSGAADIFLAYCTNRGPVAREFAQISAVNLPPGLSVGADYGLTVMKDAPREAWAFAMFILSVQGQRILESHGFAAPGAPRVNP